MSSLEKKNILGVLLDTVDCPSAAQMIIAAAHQGREFPVSALAVHGVMTGVLDSRHRYRLNRFQLLVADGQPVRWALNLLHHAGMKQRVYGPDLMMEVLGRAQEENLPVYFYGSTSEVLDSLCVKVRKHFPHIQIAGAQCSTFSRLTHEIAGNLAEKIKQSGARIVFVGLGCPRQEVWAYEFCQRVGQPIVAVGAAFAFLAGTLRQAPHWMQDFGLEWLFRLGVEPRRLWRRYLILNPAYFTLICWQSLGFKFQSEGQPPAEELLYG
jgi:N-acetylglucosaminyldiphosphoundecaprenol N-acetyl-beta-D-mannosaminyltransferase